MDLEKRYRDIFSRERAMATSVARAVIRARPVSAWEVMVPILLVFSYAKSKETREIFVQNFLFTKQLALKGARDMIKNGHSKQEIMSRIDGETKELLGSVKEGLYSEEVRREQMAEINLLIDHYCRILQAEGDHFAAWIVQAYGRLEDYMHFLEGLKQAEERVYLAALRTVGTAASDAVATRMQEMTRTLRSSAAREIFMPGGS